MYQKGFTHLALVFIILISGLGALVYYSIQNRQIKPFNITEKETPKQVDTITNDAIGTSPTSSTKNKTVTVPSNWKSYEVTDFQYKLKVKLSLPDAFSFKNSGSEMTIIDNADASELWDVSTSIYASEEGDGTPKNHYDGSSRRAWYEKYLSRRSETDKIIGVAEKPVNNTTYLEITVQTPEYDDHGNTSGSIQGKHFIYAQNGIINIIKPVSKDAFSINSMISENIEQVLSSLSTTTY